MSTTWIGILSPVRVPTPVVVNFLGHIMAHIIYNKSVLTLAIKANKFIKGSSLKQSAPNVQFRHVTPGHLEGNERAN